jgi:hypothetical protein
MTGGGAWPPGNYLTHGADHLSHGSALLILGED